jgi:hypothetical protein
MGVLGYGWDRRVGGVGVMGCERERWIYVIGGCE